MKRSKQETLNSFYTTPRQLNDPELNSHRARAEHKTKIVRPNLSLDTTGSSTLNTAQPSAKERNVIQTKNIVKVTQQINPKMPMELHISINNNIVTTDHQHSEPVTRKSIPILRRLKMGKTESQPKVKYLEEVLTSKEVLESYGELLTNYEKGEVLNYARVYFISNIQKKFNNPEAFTDREGYYKVLLNDHIAYRYEILEYMGKGSFGQALRCFDHKEKQVVALKVLKSKKKLYHQGMVETKILKFIADNDPEGKAHIVRMMEQFIFRKHIMITTELLSINLYTFIERNNFRGISLGLVKRFALQIIEALCFLRKHKIIHCDLKPENILLEQPNRSAIKLIDFGSSCFSNEKIYTYIQSRFYRAPEIMLGIPYTTGIDMWSTGCILSELFTGYPIFPGRDELEQMSMIFEVNGLPPKQMLEKATRKEVFFDRNGRSYLVRNSQGKIRVPGGRSLEEKLKCSDTDFVNFIQNCFIWSPEQRMTPEQAKSHPWLSSNSGPKLSNLSRFNLPQRRVNTLLNGTKDVSEKESNMALMNTTIVEDKNKFNTLETTRKYVRLNKSQKEDKLKLSFLDEKSLPPLQNAILPKNCKFPKTIISKLS